ncbi:uncharacterized membrane protein YoaT (DUF817 family) [Hasllibacter halocynthiae]|uniref:Uncharacterized membrane protein YoaT (DUF817 family) n=1 Tax=Hasllibacter halocynthiae TaxID=595589 RepID=A0A2T0X6X5_9RHOB|nr:DUF817 family protein [Hasllibacter halocynthiae]PRY94645.1 uncharacterized membrane protein YoaT (DUF817 family) [Hasllibacter halocynthiae]
MNRAQPSRTAPGILSGWLSLPARLVRAGLFGALLLLAIVLTAAVWQPHWPLARYDFLVLYALAVQVGMLALRLETPREALVIVLFHLTGTAMEWFKVSAGSWSYPEAGTLGAFGVPLFTGFMYASVGSFIARALRLFDMRIAPYPPHWAAFALGGAIYVNFWAHHFVPDARWALMALTLVLFWRARVRMTLHRRVVVRLPVAALAAALLLWGAENAGTLSGTWAYAGQDRWDLVAVSKFGSWYLLLYVAWVTVTIVYRDRIHREG